MIDAVLLFAFITAIGEFIVLSMFPISLRLRLLGSHVACVMVHILCAAVNLTIHWGTMTGSMTAVTAFVVSTVVLWIAKKYNGYITGGRYYRGIRSWR